VFDGIEDQLLVAFDRLGEFDERVQAAALSPGEPPDQQAADSNGQCIT